MIDPLRFERAKAEALRPVDDGGIGTLGEKTVHAVLKAYYREADMAAEVKLGRFVADLWDGQRAIEIQTRSLERLLPKLNAWLPKHPVRVVVPVARHKWLVRLDPETAAVSGKRRSPITGRPCHALAEIYPLRALLRHPNLSITVVMLDVLEYRATAPEARSGARRYDRVPLELVQEINLPGAPWAALLPEGLPRPFTAAHLRKAGGFPRRGRAAWQALKVLEGLEVINRDGKAGNSILYREI